jgi:glycosyltransferase involved in cell wall biosynthesis
MSALTGREDSKRPGVVIAWYRVPFYAAQLLAAARDALDCEFAVLATESRLGRQEIERLVRSRVVWVDARQTLTWKNLSLDIPDVFVQGGWAYRGFNSLGREVRGNGGRVVGMVDNCRKGTVRQQLGALVYRLGIRPRFDAVIVPGRSSSDLMRMHGYGSFQIHEGLYASDPTVFRKGRPLSEREKQFLFVGQFIERKGIELLVEGFSVFNRRHPGWKLTVIGAGPLKGRLVGRGVEVFPFMEAPRAAAEMQRARFLILASQEDHWPLVVHEAASCGCGLLVSDGVGSRHELVTSSNGYVFPRGSLSGIVMALEWAANLSGEQLIQVGLISSSLASAFSPQRFAQTLSGCVNAGCQGVMR